MNATPTITPPNYGTHFREWYRANKETIARVDPAFAVRSAIADLLLAQATYVLLPLDGAILHHDSLPRAEYAPHLRLPAPITAFEFTSSFNRPPADHLGMVSRRRIALCFDESIHQNFLNARPDIDAGAWVCLSIFSMDLTHGWMVYPAFTIVSGSRTIRFDAEMAAMAAAQLQELRTVGLDFGPKPPMAPLGTEMLDIRAVSLIGGETLSAALAWNDTHEEVIAALQACVAFNTARIRVTETPPPAALNHKRLAAGKLPFAAYRIFEPREAPSDFLSKTYQTADSGAGFSAARH